MKKILKPKKWIGKCDYCNCEFEYEEEDIIHDPKYSIYGIYSYVECPECHKHLDHLKQLKCSMDKMSTMQT